MNRKDVRQRDKSVRLQEISGSQNFLTRRRLVERIVGISTINKEDTVLEIGTRKGHITEVLSRRAKYVYTVEIDESLCARAKERLQNRSNVRIICGDFMKYKLPQRGEYKVFANIPYYLTTDIVRKLRDDFHPKPSVDSVLLHFLKLF